MGGVGGPSTVRAAWSDRRHGDLGADSPAVRLDPARHQLAAGEWTWLRQVHGATVAVVTEAGACAGQEADAAVTTVPGAVVAVQAADCAPVLLVGDGAVGVVHAGWRGLVAGVIEAAAAAMDGLGAPPIAARLGPCIRARCYEFGEPELTVVADAYGPTVRSTTAWGTPALDLTAGVTEALARLGVPLADDGTCTACSPRHFSHRAGGDRQRQVLAAWLDPQGPPPSDHQAKN